MKVGMYFYANGGSGEMPYQTFDFDSVTEIPECTFTKPGYKLHGWKCKDNYYAPGEQIRVKTEKMYEALDMYAVWIEEDRNPGDLNGDGATDMTDMSLLALELLGEEVIDSGLMYDADVYYDGDINLIDLTYYKQFVSGKNILLGMGADE
jgi:hypothetical protein